jgi:hypothetical protein
MFTRTGEALAYLKIVLVSSTLLFLFSCASTQRMYSGAELPAAEIALVRPVGVGIIIEKFDGKEVMSPSVAVLPGDHSIETSFTDRVFGSSSRNNATTYFTAEAGHVYIVDKVYGNGNTYRMVITDASANKQVQRYLQISGQTEKFRYWLNRGDAFFVNKKYSDALSDYSAAFSYAQPAELEALKKKIEETKKLMLIEK